MKLNFKHSKAQKEILKCLEGKSIYEMTVWTRDRAQFLKQFCDYNESRIDDIMQMFMSVAQFFLTNYKDIPEAVKDFRWFCVRCVLKLEIECR